MQRKGLAGELAVAIANDDAREIDRVLAEMKEQRNKPPEEKRLDAAYARLRDKWMGARAS